MQWGRLCQHHSVKLPRLTYPKTPPRSRAPPLCVDSVAASSFLQAPPAPPSLLCMSLDGCHAVEDERFTAPQWPSSPLGGGGWLSIRSLESGSRSRPRPPGSSLCATSIDPAPLCCYISADRPRHPSSPPRLPLPAPNRQHQRIASEDPARPGSCGPESDDTRAEKLQR
jgi:hypothetical protein